MRVYHEERLKRSRAEGFLPSACPLAAAIAFMRASLCFASLSRTATYEPNKQMPFWNMNELTALGSMTFLRCFRKYLQDLSGENSAAFKP